MACLLVSVQAADKTDRVTLRNGDTITGEIKELQLGSLRYKTDSMSTIYVDWVDVMGVVSPRMFQIELDDGDLYFGAFVEADRAGWARLSPGDSSVDVEVTRIVKIVPIGRTFWQQLDGSLSVGLSYTKASEVAQLSFSGSVERRTRKHRSKVDISSITTAQQLERDETSRNINTTGAYERLLKDRWYTGGSLSLQRNDELGIDFRALLAGVVERALVQSVRQRLLVGGGLAYNGEDSASGGNQSSVEAVVALSWAIYQPKNPETDLDLQFSVYPSLTEWDRVRSTLDATVRREIIDDFFFELQFYVSYDSDPPSADAATSDLGFVTSLGWTF